MKIGFSIIIPAYNVFKQLIITFNSIYPQLSDNDQVIIADNGSTDGLSDDFYPRYKHISYFRSVDHCSESTILNIAIREYAVNDNIIVLDPLSIMQPDFLKEARKICDDKTIIICRADRYNQKKAVVIDKKLPIKILNSELCDMYALIFPKNPAFKVGLFNEYYIEDNSCSHGITLCDCLIKMQKCNLRFSDNTKVIRQIGKDRKNLDKRMADVFCSKMEDGTYKYIDENGKCRIIDESKLVSATILIPSKQCDDLIYDTKSQIRENDQLVIFSGGSENIVKRLKEAIKASKNDCIILLNPESNFDTADFIIDMKLNYNKDSFSIMLSDEYDTSDITIDNVFRVKDKLNMTFFRGLFNDKVLEVTQNNTNKIIKKLVLTSPERKELIQRVEQTYQKNRRRDRKKERPGVDKSSPGKLVDKNKVIKAGKIVKPKARIAPSSQVSSYRSVWNLPKIEYKEGKKPNIILISDVKGWAWWYKSEQLKKYLSDEFNFDITSVVDSRKRIITSKYDLCLTFGYSYVYTILDAPIHKRISGVTAHRPLSILRPRMQEVAVTHANSILLLEELKRMHPIIYYVPNGVDEELFRIVKSIPESRDKIVVGHIGKLCPQKGQKEIIEPAVKKANANYINNYSSYLNKKPFDKMYEIYQEMDVFIVASTEDGTPNPALEAAACGRPIISNKIGNMPEFIKDGYNGFIVDKHPNAYSEKIKYLSEHRNKLIEMGNNARKTIEEGWTWKIQAENYRKMFREMLYNEKTVEKLTNGEQ
uniref:Putative glycosyltransferase n=1 Tax=viral metagenome TaxID=1070528 RepID=A0A6M3IX95_9ZZZZ